MRKAGRTPGILFSLPGDASILLSMETKQVNALVGVAGFPPAVFHMYACILDMQPHVGKNDTSLTATVLMQLRTHEKSGLLSQIFSLHLERDHSEPSIFPVLVRTDQSFNWVTLASRASLREVALLKSPYTLQPRILHRDPVTDAVENLTLMYCPPERRVMVPVRIKVCLTTIERHCSLHAHGVRSRQLRKGLCGTYLQGISL